MCIIGVPKVLIITLGSAIWLQFQNIVQIFLTKRILLSLTNPLWRRAFLRLMKFLSVSVNVIILTFQATPYSKNWLEPILQLISAQRARNLEIGEVKMNFVFGNVGRMLEFTNSTIGLLHRRADWCQVNYSGLRSWGMQRDLERNGAKIFSHSLRRQNFLLAGIQYR